MFEKDFPHKLSFGDTKPDTKSPVQTYLSRVIPLVFRLSVALDVLGRALTETLQSRGRFAPHLGAGRGESYA